jgi:dephospho-CoA kinase
LSDIVREEAKEIFHKQNPDKHISRAELQDTGNLLRQEGGPGVLAKRVSAKIKKSIQQEWLIDGIRNPAEISELKKLNHFYLIGLKTEPEVIIKRLISRKRVSDIAESSELLKRMEREWGIGEPEEGQQVGKCLKLADFTVKNNKTLNDLKIKVLELLSIIKEKNAN